MAGALSPDEDGVGLRSEMGCGQCAQATSERCVAPASALGGCPRSCSCGSGAAEAEEDEDEEEEDEDDEDEEDEDEEEEDDER